VGVGDGSGVSLGCGGASVGVLVAAVISSGSDFSVVGIAASGVLDGSLIAIWVLSGADLHAPWEKIRDAPKTMTTILAGKEDNLLMIDLR
jgi:hypothetical protein